MEDGTECEVLLVVMSGMVPIMEDWEERLKANGAVGWRYWYVDFEMVGKTVGR